jgi:hypothetical protein
VSHNIRLLARCLINRSHSSEIVKVRPALRPYGPTLVTLTFDHLFAKVLPRETQRLIAGAIGLAGTIKGVLIVNTVVPRMSLRISSAALGAAWLTDTIAEVADPWLQSQGFTPITDHVPYVVLHTALSLLGYAIQKRYEAKHLPRIIETFLSPMAVAEARLKKLMPKGKIKRH